MAELWYGHFDSTPEDPRKLLASQWAAYIEAFITSGIRNGGACLEVTESRGMAVKIDTGIANVRGYIIRITEDFNGRYYNVAVPPSHPQYPRIDRLVLRLDRKTKRSVEPVISMGVAALNPVPPPLIRTETDVYELSLAQIKVAANAVTITKTDITDERFETDLCGVSNSVLGLDPSAWQRQFEDFLQSITDVSEEYKAAFKQAFDALLVDIKNEYAAWKGTIDAWKNMTITALAEAVSFCFENQFAVPGTVYTLDDGTEGTIVEELRYAATNALLARQTTVFQMDNSIEEAQTVYDTDGSIFRNVLIITTFQDGKPRMEAKSI